MCCFICKIQWYFARGSRTALWWSTNSTISPLVLSKVVYLLNASEWFGILGFVSILYSDIFNSSVDVTYLITQHPPSIWHIFQNVCNTSLRIHILLLPLPLYFSLSSRLPPPLSQSYPYFSLWSRLLVIYMYIYIYVNIYIYICSATF